jgi:hypothetical protein
MPSSLVQRIRIRSNALSTDSKAANAPSYPSRAVEANPANTIEMTRSTGYRVRRHVRLCSIASTLVSNSTPNALSQRSAIFHIEEKCLHRRHLVCDRLNAKITDARRHPKWSVGVWGLVPK